VTREGFFEASGDLLVIDLARTREPIRLLRAVLAIRLPGADGPAAARALSRIVALGWSAPVFRRGARCESEEFVLTSGREIVAIGNAAGVVRQARDVAAKHWCARPRGLVGADARQRATRVVAAEGDGCVTERGAVRNICRWVTACAASRRGCAGAVVVTACAGKRCEDEHAAQKPEGADLLSGGAFSTRMKPSHGLILPYGRC